MDKLEHNFSRPIARHRKQIYIWSTVLSCLPFFGGMMGVGLGYLPPAESYFWAAIICYTGLMVPLIAAWWDAPDENRTTLERAFEFCLIWVPVTAFSQVLWEFPWLIMELMGLMNGIGPDDKWLWAWWGYAAVDTRYLSSNGAVFAMEALAVPGGFGLCWVLHQLFTQSHDVEKRLRALMIMLLAFTEMLTVVIIYLISELYDGLHHLDYSTYGPTFSFWFVFIYMNIAWLIVPLMAIPYVVKMIDYMYRVELPAVIAVKRVRTQSGPNQIPASGKIVPA